MNEIDKNGSFRSFWGSISSKKIDLNRDGIEIDQNDQKPTSNDQDRSPKFFEKKKTAEQSTLLHFHSERCNGCPYWSISTLDCTASFYERVQSNCEKNSKAIKYWLLRLENVSYEDDEVLRQQEIEEINTILESLIV